MPTPRRLLSQKTSAFIVSALLLPVLLIGLTSSRTLAQENEPPERIEAFKLFDQSKFTDAIPLLEKVVKASPSDVPALERLGWALFVVSPSISDPAERKKTLDRARTFLNRSKDLGNDSELLKTALENLARDDSSETSFSKVKEADVAMREGEAAHIKGELDKAIVGYERALKLDPKLYLAALFAGDMYFKKGYQAKEQRIRDENFNKAGEWFAKAIAIEPNAETAHRYWGDALMHQGKQQEAMVKFIDGIIADPGDRKAYVGLSQWGQRNNVSMAHPAIEIPVKVSPAGDKKVDVSLAPGLLERTDGSKAWEQYASVRTKWASEDFAKAFPTETAYRHSLREEAEALSKTAAAASELLKSGKVQSLSPSLTALVKLNESGLLESYIFFARADAGIVRDYYAYQRANHEKLRRYWTDFVISK